jgi:hypothetical protein
VGVSGISTHTLTHSSEHWTPSWNKTKKKLEKHESRKREKKGGVECTGRGDVCSYLFRPRVRKTLCNVVAPRASSQLHTHTHTCKRNGENKKLKRRRRRTGWRPRAHSFFFLVHHCQFECRNRLGRLYNFLFWTLLESVFDFIEMKEIGRLQCHSNLSNEELIPIVLQGLNFILFWNTHTHTIWLCG